MGASNSRQVAINGDVLHSEVMLSDGTDLGVVLYCVKRVAILES